MIVGVPDYNQLSETAIGWLNLAWAITIKEVEDFHEISSVFDEIDEQHGPEKAELEIQRHWSAAQYRLNNSISLLQQSLELFLKTRIAEVSPFLLVSGDPKSWPKPDATGNVDFSNFRTIDAVHLCRAVNIVSAVSLPNGFAEFYDRLRKHRNKISHLTAAGIQAEAKSILVDILTAHQYLFPGNRWVSFRRDYLTSTGNYRDDELIYDGEDHTHDILSEEVAAALAELEPSQLKKFFQYDPKQPGLCCPRCLELRTGWSDREYEFAQIQEDGLIRCVTCLSVYTKEEYKAEFPEIADDLDRNLP